MSHLVVELHILQFGEHKAHSPEPSCNGVRFVELHMVHWVRSLHFEQPLFVLHEKQPDRFVGEGVPNPGRHWSHCTGGPGLHVVQSGIWQDPVVVAMVDPAVVAVVGATVVAAAVEGV